MTDNVRGLADQLLEYAVKKGDRGLLTYINERTEKALKLSTATVKYAGELKSEERASLERAVRAKFPEAQEIEFTPDPHLVAGVKIAFRDYQYDGSVQGKFERVKANIN